MNIGRKFRFVIVIVFALAGVLACNNTKESDIERVRLGLLTGIHLTTMPDSEKRMTS